jgi:hypothetical protein
MTQESSTHANEGGKRERENLEKFRQLTLAERGELLVIACRAAAAIEANRKKMGLPPTEPAPWPESTWQFLRKAAQRHREQATQPDSRTDAQQ